MRVLQIDEISQVSGGNFFETIGAMVIGTFTGASSGILKAATVGGNSGGILGVGIIGNLGGVIVGGVAGGLLGAMYGMVNNWDKTCEWFNATAEQWFDLIAPLPK
ncbi:hypothetical protein J2X14_002093 [Pantoea alhagi]|uniref:hypothetical protein n=1 Tax=Mixta sp. BE291 TaxID=3158787 RepID=UPI002855B12C|nr:hypothetical protein [Pantoea alhagi]